MKQSYRFGCLYEIDFNKTLERLAELTDRVSFANLSRTGNEQGITGGLVVMANVVVYLKNSRVNGISEE